MTKKVELFSGKVLTVPPTDVSANRYKWLKLSEAEPSLGAPSVNGAFIYSDTTGVRNWTTQLTTDSNGNLQTLGVTITGNRIEARNPDEVLEIGTVVGGTSKVVIDGDLTVNGVINFQGGIQELNLAQGQAILIGGAEVLSETSLGPGVVNSNLQTVGTITQGTWHADVIETQYGGTGLGGVKENAVLVGDGTNPMREEVGQPFQVLQVDATGRPVFQGLDYGRY